jgi:hypothetical protein
MPKVTFVTEKKEKKVFEVPKGANLRREALKNGYKLGLIHVKSGVENLGPVGLGEKLINATVYLFPRIGHEHDTRVASGCRVEGDVEIQNQPFLPQSEVFWQ